MRRLAAYYAPQQVLLAFAVRWPNVRCVEADIIRFNPREFLLSPELAELFKKERAAFLASPDESFLSDRRFRLIELQRLYEFYRDSNRLLDAERILKTIALEMGLESDDAGDGTKKVEITKITRTIIDPAPRDQ